MGRSLPFPPPKTPIRRSPTCPSRFSTISNAPIPPLLLPRLISQPIGLPFFLPAKRPTRAAFTYPLFDGGAVLRSSPERNEQISSRPRTAASFPRSWATTKTPPARRSRQAASLFPSRRIPSKKKLHTSLPFCGASVGSGPCHLGRGPKQGRTTGKKNLLVPPFPLSFAAEGVHLIRTALPPSFFPSLRPRFQYHLLLANIVREAGSPFGTRVPILLFPWAAQCRGPRGRPSVRASAFFNAHTFPPKYRAARKTGLFFFPDRNRRMRFHTPSACLAARAKTDGTNILFPLCSAAAVIGPLRVRTPLSSRRGASYGTQADQYAFSFSARRQRLRREAPPNPGASRLL